MSTLCDVTLRWSATPDQLKALGAALWRWCNRSAADSGVYQYLDNQALADLIAGKFPASSQTPWPAESRGVHFKVRTDLSRGPQATIDSLRRALPPQGVEDIVVDGDSWWLVETKNKTCVSG